MRIRGSLQPSRLASWSMVGTGLAMATQLIRDRWPAVVAVLIVASAGLAWVAAREVRHDDSLGWTLVVGHAVATIGTILVVVIIGFPGTRDRSWDASSVVTVAFAAAALVAGTAAALGRAVEGRDRRARP